MLEGLFGSCFKAKCKAEIKSIKARIELVRRRSEAKQRFLKEDLSKLLVNGLHHDAFSRTEEYLALQNILDSYDFIEQTCEHIKGQLSYMQKLRECPEDCREAVGSLIFAAARFSDLPELRDLRDLLKQRYGNSLERVVNQKFLEKLNSKPPERETKMKLLKDIASEYSLKWDVKGSEQRMAPLSPSTQIQSQTRKHGNNHVAPKDYNQPIMKGESTRPNNCENATMEKRSELASGVNQMHRSAKGTFNTREDNNIPERKEDVLRHGHRHVNDGEKKHTDMEGFKRDCRTPEWDRPDATKQRPELDKAKDQAPQGADVEYLRRNKPVIHNPNSVMEGRPEILLPNGEETDAADKFRSNYAKQDTWPKSMRSRRSHEAIRSENVDTGFMIHNNGVNNISNGNSDTTPFHGQSRVERQDITSVPNYRSERDVERLRTDVLGESSTQATPYSRSRSSKLPPKARDSNHRSSRGSRHENSVSDRPFMDPSFHNRDHHAVEFLGKIQKEADQSKHEKERAELIPPQAHYPKDFDYDHNGMLPLPKPRAIRRKHHRSLTHENLVGILEDAGAIRRSSNSRRREHSRKGLQISSDDEKPKGDKEERTIDKMLQHYCKKRSGYEREKLRPKSNDHHAEQSTVLAGESSRDQRRGVRDKKSEHNPKHTRSFSLPSNHEDIKAFTRVKSLQPDDRERHVHPKLPDYDDFVARLAALRGRRGDEF